MLDTNDFKRSVKKWVRDNPKASLADLADFCEDLIPATQFQSHSWLVEQTVGWYQNVINSRRHLNEQDDNLDDEE